jgi:NAD(P)-dependent dehydrogenase (short-subunit alcohol dehydrogenase family)
MKKQKKGKIVNISSVAAKTGGLLVGAHYTASKAGVIALGKSLAHELAPYSINVNTVAPGIVDTETTRTVFTSEEILGVIRNIPLGRLATPEDVAGCVLFLVSEAANYLTGITLDVNGGQLMD